jgi:putative oxidoreductase
MTNLRSRWKDAAPEIRSILRMVAGILFVLPGTVKLFAFPVGMPPNGGTALLFSQVGIGGILETFGGLLMLLGFCTRPVAFILSGEMAVAYFQFHLPHSYWPVVNGGSPAILFCFIWLYFSSAGAGPWSLDSIRSKPSDIGV